MKNQLQNQSQADQASPAATDAAGQELSRALLEIERLQRENEVLRKGAAAPTGLSAQRGKLRTYRVRLKDCRPKLSKRCISPRHDARPEIREMPPVTFEDLDLFQNEAGHDPAKLTDAAWQRFIAGNPIVKETSFDGAVRERVIDPMRDKKQFTIDPQQGEHTDWLTLRAESPADAFELFRKFSGIVSTIQSPIVELVSDGADEQPAARDVPQLAGV